jgi:hypothetical protein
MPPEREIVIESMTVYDLVPLPAKCNFGAGQCLRQLVKGTETYPLYETLEPPG